ASLLHEIVLVVRHEHADAPYPVALLRACRKRPRRRGAECSDEIAPSKANAHLTLPCLEPYRGMIAQPKAVVPLEGLPHPGPARARAQQVGQGPCGDRAHTRQGSASEGTARGEARADGLTASLESAQVHQ